MDTILNLYLCCQKSLRKLGGKVALQLIVKVAPQTRVAPAMDTVTLRLREEEDVEHNIKHAEAEDHAEFRFDLNDPQWDVWEAKYEKAGPASTPVLKSRADAGGGNVKAPNISRDTDVLYIRTVEWSTTTKLSTDLDGAGPRPASVLLGHNGKHQVSLHEVNGEQTNIFLFDKKIMEQGTWQSLPYSAAPTLHQVGNLVITDVSSSNGTQDYFKWDPESDDTDLQTPTVSFSILNAGAIDSRAYRWTVWFAPTAEIHTSSTTDWTLNASKATGTIDHQGPVVIDLTSEDLAGHLDESVHTRGPYVYDIRVVEFGGPIPSNGESGATDAAQFKQPYLEWIPSTFQDANGDTQPGHNVWMQFTEDDSGEVQLRANYYLFPNPVTNSAGMKNMKLIPMNPQFMEKPEVDAPTEAGILHGGKEGIVAYRITPDENDGDWRVIFTGDVAKSPESTRNHSFSRMIPVNRDRPLDSIIPYTSNASRGGIGNNFDGKWVAIWAYTPRVYKRTVAHKPTKEVKDHVVGMSTGIPNAIVIGKSYAAMNGAYFSDLAMDPIGSVGVGGAGAWRRGLPIFNDGKYYRRWGFGFNATGKDFQVGLGDWQEEGGVYSYFRPKVVEAFPYGMDGVQALIVDGKAEAMTVPTTPTTPKDGSVNNGIFLNLPFQNWAGQALYIKKREDGAKELSAVGMSSTGEHMFMLLNYKAGSAVELRNLFRVYGQATPNGNRTDDVYHTGTYTVPGSAVTKTWQSWAVPFQPPSNGVVSLRLQEVWNRSQGNENYMAKAPIVSNAVVLDGSSAVQFSYRKREKRSPTDPFGPLNFLTRGRATNRPIASMITASSK